MASVPACSSKSQNSVVNFWSAVQDEQSLAAQKAVQRVGEIPTELYQERAVRPGSDSGNVHSSRRQLDDDKHIVGRR